MNAGDSRRVGRWAAVLLAGSLLAGCSSVSGQQAGDVLSPQGKPSVPASSSATPAANGVSPDVDNVPDTRAEARQFVSDVAFRPDDWSRGFVEQSVSESPPDTWAVLGEGCRWQREKLPEGVLASLSRYSELPGDGGRGTVEVTTAVTFHTTVLGADDQLSTTLKEALRCPEQQIRADERVVGLTSLGTSHIDQKQIVAEDQVFEAGEYLGPGSQDGKGHPYRWWVARLAMVTVAVSVKGAPGYTAEELDAILIRGMEQMLNRSRAKLLGGQA